MKKTDILHFLSLDYGNEITMVLCERDTGEHHRVETDYKKIRKVLAEYNVAVPLDLDVEESRQHKTFLYVDQRCCFLVFRSDT